MPTAPARTAASRAGGRDRRRLAFAYHPRSFETFEIAEAARDVCDLVWVVDTTMPEVASMQRLLARLGEVVDATGLDHDAAARRIAEARPDGILALSDAMLPWTAAVAQRLGLPFDSPQTAENLADKQAQRIALRDGGLPVPAFWTVPDDDDDAGWQRLAREAVFPAVVKPRHSELSRDTLRAASLEQLRALVAEIGAQAPADRAELVLEEYLADRPQPHRPPFADYVSVESMVSDGHISHLAVNGRFPTAEPFRETGFFIPAALPADEHAAVLDVATRAIRSVGVTLGFLHTEIKMTPDGPRVIEVNGRIGGGVVDMLRRAAGVELMPIALRLALGEHVTFEAPLACTGVAYILIAQAPVTLRRVGAIDGLDELRAHAGVDEVILNRGPGAEIDWRAGSNEYLYLVHGLVEDHDALARLDAYAKRHVRVRAA